LLRETWTRSIPESLQSSSATVFDPDASNWKLTIRVGRSPEETVNHEDTKDTKRKQKRLLVVWELLIREGNGSASGTHLKSKEASFFASLASWRFAFVVL
jgi:hypothetical protein